MEGYITNFICDFLGVLNNSKEHIPPKADKKIFTSEIFQNFDFLQWACDRVYNVHAQNWRKKIYLDSSYNLALLGMPAF